MANTIVTLSGDDAELYKAFQRILDSQKKIDEGYDKVRQASRRAAKEAEAAAKDEERENDRRRQSIGSVAESVLSLAAAYASVSTATQTVAKVQADYVERQEKSLELARQLAAAQQEAAKNLAGQTPQAISATLQKTVPDIARRAGFSDLPAVTTALGAAASIIGEDRAQGVVEQSARITRFTPGELQTTATATADLLSATGLKDAREGLALLASTGSVARPEQLAKLATGAAVAANSAIGGSPQQDRIAAAKEGVALYAKLSKVDPQGQSAATATGQLIGQVGGLFTDTKGARERADKIERLTEALESNKVTIARAEEARTKAEGRGDKVGVMDAENDLRRALAGAKRDESELRGLQAISAAVAVDPGTFTGRLEKIRQTPELSQQLNETLTGEQKFLPLFRQLIAGGNEFAAEFDTALKTITTDVKAFEAVAGSVVATPQTAIVSAEQQARVAANIQSATDVDGQVRAAISGISLQAMGASSTDFLTGVGNVFNANLGNYGSRTVDSLPNYIEGAQTTLRDRLDYISQGGGTEAQAQTVAAAIAAIEGLARLPETLEAVAATGRAQEDFLKRQTRLAEETKSILERMGGNGAPPAAAVRAQSQMNVTSGDFGGSGASSGPSW
jgi:hypothetical protein